MYIELGCWPGDSLTGCLFSYSVGVAMFFSGCLSVGLVIILLAAYSVELLRWRASLLILHF